MVHSLDINESNAYYEQNKHLFEVFEQQEDPRIKQARDLMIAVTNDERKKRFAEKQDATDNHICNCGHRRIEHTKSYSLHYTEGFCTIGDCTCQHFNFNRASAVEPIPKMKKCKEEMCGVLVSEDAANYCHHHHYLNKKA